MWHGTCVFTNGLITSHGLDKWMYLTMNIASYLLFGFIVLLDMGSLCSPGWPHT